MKINDAKVTTVEKVIQIDVTYNKATFSLYFKTFNGKVPGNYKDNTSTSYLTYYNENSDKVRKEHFAYFKNYIEKTFD